MDFFQMKVGTSLSEEEGVCKAVCTLHIHTRLNFLITFELLNVFKSKDALWLLPDGKRVCGQPVVPLCFGFILPITTASILPQCGLATASMVTLCFFLSTRYASSFLSGILKELVPLTLRSEDSQIWSQIWWDESACFPSSRWVVLKVTAKAGKWKCFCSFQYSCVQPAYFGTLTFTLKGKALSHFKMTSVALILYWKW